MDQLGRSPFAKWFEDLNAQAAAKVTTALIRIQQGNFSNAKGVGSGVYETRISSAPATAFTSAKTERRS